MISRPSADDLKPLQVGRYPPLATASAPTRDPPAHVARGLPSRPMRLVGGVLVLPKPLLTASFRRKISTGLSRPKIVRTRRLRGRSRWMPRIQRLSCPHEKPGTIVIGHVATERAVAGPGKFVAAEGSSPKTANRYNRSGPSTNIGNMMTRPTNVEESHRHHFVPEFLLAPWAIEESCTGTGGTSAKAVFRANVGARRDSASK